MLKQKIIKVALWSLALLIVPLTLQLTIGTGIDGQGFNWKPGDFVFAWTAWFLAGSAYHVLTFKVKDEVQSIKIGVAVALVLAFIWVGAATGFEGIIDRFVN